MDVLYRAKATATGGRDGTARTDDGVISVELSVPKSMGGAGKPGATNPEQLFAAGYAACFAGALGLVARQQKVDIGTPKITAEVDIGKDASGGFGLAVALTAEIPDVPYDQAMALVEAAHQVCPYSKATRGNIEVKLAVV